MKKLAKNCIVENCIPTPSSCVEWNGGDIEYLGITNGDSLNTLMWELLEKIEAVTGDNLASFDIDSLADICAKNAPTEITVLSILNVVKDNQICLKDFIDTLNDKLNTLLGDEKIDVNLSCYAQFDNLGNGLSINRNQLDQLIINELCNHKQRIESVEGDIIVIKNQLENLDTTATVEELHYSTCIDSGVKPNSIQVKAIAEELCDLEEATGVNTDIASALSKTPADLNSKFGLLTGWDLNPANWAENYGNLLIVAGQLLARIEYMEANCCALSCEDIKLGFSAIFNEDMDGIILKFTFGAGTSIPAGFTDKGSKGTFTDVDGNVESFSLSISNNAQIEIPISGLNLSGNIEVDINAKIGNASLTCEKCIDKIVKSSTCAYCEITATGTEGSSAVLVYSMGDESSIVATPVVDEPTTSTTTTTTVAPTTTTTTTVAPSTTTTTTV